MGHCHRVASIYDISVTPVHPCSSLPPHPRLASLLRLDHRSIPCKPLQLSTPAQFLPLLTCPQLQPLIPARHRSPRTGVIFVPPTVKRRPCRHLRSLPYRTREPKPYRHHIASPPCPTPLPLSRSTACI
ncbi:unnamed protein product [Chondrus crispus]|uniref:Uncharacterized protein n=1 Tax=Chondrus crispus TaxID=2769 RepID=R7QKE9_CHOCR|nr:unnamed protein product [Chondrus crispus]CDF38539.1 unnamed protein product [Chondrus crispus]|eukprot:XP_005718432.1 unnamed protein product [Chondrus crispus]